MKGDVSIVIIVKLDQCRVRLRKLGAYSESMAGATCSSSNFVGLFFFISIKW
jgi:hypothetical protein